MKLNRNEMCIILFMSIFCIDGVVGNCLSKYQKSIYVIESALQTIKFILAYFVTKIIFREFSLDEHSKKINKFIRSLVIFLITIGFVFNYLNKNRRYDTFYGGNSLIMFFSHSTYLNAFCVALITILTYYLKKYKNNVYYIVILLGIMALTYKAKAFIFIVSYIIFMIYYITSVKTKKICFLGMSILSFIGVPGMVIIFKLFYEKFIYFSVKHGDTARNILTNKSIEILKDSFPFGLGFGTFGSAVSGKSYSQAYYELGISGVYGLERKNPIFISDTFWPMILGENGLIGFISIIIIIFLFLRINYRYRCVKADGYWFAAIIPILYLLISSIGESSFANQIAVNLFFIISIINVTLSNNIRKHR